VTDFVDGDGIVAWIVEHGDLDASDVRAVLSIELEFMARAGIASAPVGYEFTFYGPSDVSSTSTLDTLRIANDAQRLAGVPVEIGHQVLEKELAFLEMRGMA
jgi:hypothetical protein